MASVLRKSQAVGLAPTDVSKQGLLDALATNSKGSFDELGSPFDYHFMAICISELANFMPSYDPALTGLLTDLFDCPPINEEKKRSGAGKLIPFPGISFIMGTATHNLGALIPKEGWGSGFMARTILIFSNEEIVPEDMFKKVETDEEVEDELAAGLRRIGQMRGPMEWEPEAQHKLREFRVNQRKDAPVHNRLAHYVTRRWLHLAKLCMIAALSDERQCVLTEDFDTALAWLLDAERDMPEIFKDMQTHEDGQVYEELRLAVWKEYIRRGKHGVPISWVVAWVSQRVGSYAVRHVLEVAEKGEYIQRVAGTSGDEAEYMPGSTTGPNPGAI
jgi:hypothetical protein